MSTGAPSILGVALGQIRYRFSVAAIGFGVFFGWLLTCATPLCIYASYFAGPFSETSRWIFSAAIALIPIVLTYRCRGWIVRKALEEAPPDPVSGSDVANAGLAVIQLALTLAGSLVAIIATLIALIVTGLLLYGGYLLLTMLSVPMAVLIGAMIVALAILAAAWR